MKINYIIAILIISCNHLETLREGNSTVEISNKRLDEIEIAYNKLITEELILFEIEHKTVLISKDYILVIFFGEDVLYFGNFYSKIKCKLPKQIRKKDSNIFRFYLIKRYEEKNLAYIWTCDSGISLRTKLKKISVLLLPELDRYCDYEIELK